MAQTSQLPRVIRFGVFEVDVQSGELRRNGVKLKLQEQPLQVLCVLLEHPGEVVTREDLHSRLWPADTYVDFEHGLNAAVKRLRDALGDSAENPRFVETLARRGYRFIGIPEVPAATSPSWHTAWRWPSTNSAIVVGSVLCAIALFFLGYRHSIAPKTVTVTMIPVVTNVGEKYTPTLSPDGQHVAFIWNGGSGTNFSLYVKVVGTEESLRLTKQASLDFSPAWSPDGRYIAFCRISKDSAGIYIIPALGGAERRVRSTLWDEQEFYEVFWFMGHLSWSPNGKLLAYSDRATSKQPATSIFLLSLDTLDVRKLTVPPHLKSDFNPEFSPDGQTLAFARVSAGGQSIYVMPISGGEEKRIVASSSGKARFAWTPNGREIVYADLNYLWKTSLDGGEPERLQFSQDGYQPSISGSRLVFVKTSLDYNIWQRRLKSSVSAGRPDRLVPTTRLESGPQFSPDGNRIAFESTRSGDYEIWVSRSDGSGLMQLTHLNSLTGTPRWSPDGQRIVFDSRAGGNSDIFCVDDQGGPLHKLTNEPSIEAVPSWSHDGRWIYFASNRTDGWEMWKMPSAGGLAVQVTRHGGYAAFESPDRKFLYYAKGPGVRGLWRVPVDGGEEVEVVSSLEAGYWGYWAVVDDGIYYLDTAAKPKIVFFNTTTHETTPVFDLESPPVKEAPGLAISPDKSTILYTQLDSSTTDIILVENFR